MANIDRYVNKKKKQLEGGQVEFEKKIIKDGANKFRIIGDIKFVFEHWFKSKDGVSIHSICSKHYNEEGEVVGECRICKEYDNAKKLLADDEASPSESEIERAEEIVGDRIAEGDQYPSPWKAREFAYMNVIDRDDNFCKDNKKTKVLCKNKSQAGITSGRGGMFDSVVEMFEEYGDYEKYDIKMKKSGKKMDTGYTCFKEGDSELTKEELKYERIDLEEISKPTPDNFLKGWLEVGVKKKEEGKDSASKPAKKNIFVKGAGKSTSKKEEKEEDNSSESEENNEEQQEEQQEEKQEKKSNTKSFKVKKEEPKKEKKEEKKKEEEEELAECPECGANIPITSEKCPECGAVFDGIEDENSDV